MHAHNEHEIELHDQNSESDQFPHQEGLHIDSYSGGDNHSPNQNQSPYSHQETNLASNNDTQEYIHADTQNQNVPNANSQAPTQNQSQTQNEHSPQHHHSRNNGDKPRQFSLLTKNLLSFPLVCLFCCIFTLSLILMSIVFGVHSHLITRCSSFQGLIGGFLFILVGQSLFFLGLLFVGHYIHTKNPTAKILCCIPFRIIPICSLCISCLGFIGMLLFFILSLALIQTTLTNVSGSYSHSSLNENVQIVRDSNGVLHIEAKTEYDLYFAQGFASAQERMFQMDLQRLAAKGELSAVVGSGGLSIDKFARTLNLLRRSELDLASLSTRAMNALVAYADGVNSYIEKTPTAKYGPEYFLLGHSPDKWTPVDSLLISKLVAYDLSANRAEEIQRYILMKYGFSLERVLELVPMYPIDEVTTLTVEDLNLSVNQSEGLRIEQELRDNSGAYIPEVARTKKKRFAGSGRMFDFPSYGEKKGGSSWFDTFIHRKESRGASNSWAFGSSWMKSGVDPVNCNDPHLGIVAPNIWLLTHLKCDSCDIDLIGGAFPGVPAILIGKNKNFVWSLTSGIVDVVDLFVMNDTTTVNGRERYIYKNESLFYTIRNEVIKVSGEDDEILEVKDTILGPIVNEIYEIPGPEQLSMYWQTLHNNDTAIDCLVHLASARNFTDFVNALEYFPGPSQLFLYMDTEKNIGIKVPGNLPIRKKGHSGAVPVMGDGRWEYEGLIPYKEMPEVYRPTRDFIYTANIKITPNGYPYLLSVDFRPPFRFKRIKAMIDKKTNSLNEKNSLDVDDMIEMQLDHYSQMFLELKDYGTWEAIYQILKDDEKVSPFAKELAAWDGQMNVGTKAAAIWEFWLKKMSEWPKVFTENRIEFTLFGVQYLMKRRRDGICKDYDCYEEGAIKLREVAESMDYNMVSWGSVHKLQMDHVLLGGTQLKCASSRSISNMISGTENVFDMDVNYISPNGTTFDSKNGASYRQIVQHNADDRFIIPLGMSGNWFSRSYDRFMSKYKNGEFIPMQLSDYSRTHTLTLKSSKKR